MKKQYFPEAMSDYLNYCFTHLQIEVIVCRKYQCDADWRLEPRELSHSYFTQWEKGEASLTLAEQNFRLHPGDLIIFGSGITHRITPLNNSECTMVNLHFQGLLDGVLDWNNFFNLSGVYPNLPGGRPERTDFLAAICENQLPGWQTYAASTVRQLLYEALLLQAPNLKPPPKNWQRWRGIPEKLEQYCHLPEFNPYQLARELQISKIYFRQLFKEQFHRTPQQYLQQLRLTRAQHQLLYSAKPAKEIATDCGFNDLNFFYRVFKRHTGQTPAEFRVNPLQKLP